jgi:hypothetical protein
MPPPLLLVTLKVVHVTRWGEAAVAALIVKRGWMMRKATYML